MSPSFRAEVRACVRHLDEGMHAVESVKERLRSAGAQRGIHVGKKGMQDGSDECVEWYAGQVLDVLEKESWFAVNSIINCVDRFCPEVAPS